VFPVAAVAVCSQLEATVLAPAANMRAESEAMVRLTLESQERANMENWSDEDTAGGEGRVSGGEESAETGAAGINCRTV
jgi:hypothetical protein